MTLSTSIICGSILFLYAASVNGFYVGRSMSYPGDAQLHKYSDINTERSFSPDQNDLTDLYSPLIESFLPTADPDIPVEDIVPICMNALQNNNYPSPNAGLEVNFNFSSDRCRAALGGDLKKFIEFANNPTFGSMIDCKEWKILNTGPLIAGTNTRGALQTFLVEVTPEESSNNGIVSSRRFLWTLQKERRPPRSNCWLIHEVIYTKNAFSLTL